MNDLLKFSGFALTREQMTKIKGGFDPNGCYAKYSDGSVGGCQPGGGSGSCEWLVMMNYALKTCCTGACKSWSW